MTTSTVNGKTAASARWNSRQIAVMALLVAIGVVLSFIESPEMFGFLRYDASNVPAAIAGLALGPVAGLTVGVLTACVHGLIFADFSGALMSILAVAGFVLPLALLYRRQPAVKSLVAGTLLAIVLATAMAVLGNLVVTPLYLGVPLDAVIGMIVPILLPFNIFKAGVNGLIACVLYARVDQLLAPFGGRALKR